MSKSYNFHATQLNVSVNDDFPFCVLKSDSQGKLIAEYSVEIEMLKLLERAFNFSSHFVSANLEWGMFDHRTQKWSGVIGQVANGTTNFGMCELTYSEERTRAVDFSRFIVSSQMTFISQSAAGGGVNDWITPSLANYIWLINLCLFVFTLVSIYVAQLLLYRLSIHRDKNNNNILENVCEISWKLFSIYLRQPITNQSRQVQIRLIYSFWMVTAFLLSTFLCISFCSILTVPAPARPIDTVEDLLEAIGDDSHFLIAKDHSNELSSYLYASPSESIRYTIGRHINRTKRKMLRNYSEVIKTVESDRKVVSIGNRIFLQMQKHFYASKALHIGSGYVELDQLAWPMAKGSKLIRPFNMMILRAQEMGFFQFWLQETIRRQSVKIGFWPKVADKIVNENVARKLTLKDVWLICILWTFGFTLAILMYCSEVFVYCVSQKFNL